MVRMMGSFVLAFSCMCLVAPMSWAQQSPVQEVEYIPVPEEPESASTEPGQLPQSVPNTPVGTVTYPQRIVLGYSDVKFVEIPQGQLIEYDPQGQLIEYDPGMVMQPSRPDIYQYPNKAVWQAPDYQYPKIKRTSHTVAGHATDKCEKCAAAKQCRPGYALCPTTERECGARPHGKCLRRLWEWMTFCPTRTCACSGRVCNWSVTPPMYYYFLNERPGCCGSPCASGCPTQH